MNGISFGVELSKPEEMSVKEDWLTILKGLEREEIEEVLSQTFCDRCKVNLHARVQSIANRKRTKKLSISSPESTILNNTPDKYIESYTTSIQESSSKSDSYKTPENIHSRNQKHFSNKFSVNNKHLSSSTQSKSGKSLDDGIHGFSSMEDDDLHSDEQKEMARFRNIGRKINFVHFERVYGKNMNILQGLELHTQVFNPEEQKKIVESVYEFQRLGQKGRLRARTYTQPTKWMRGKGRITIQFGCCYNYAVDKNGNPPGIIREEEVDPLPQVFKQMIKRMVRWHVLPPTCIPNSCIVNIYEEGDCIPPHIDHHDFVRPFCTASFLTECNILFGSSLKIVGPGEFTGPVSIPLPVGSVLILKGNGADVAKHCVPAVPAKRISITFRKMDERKIPYGYVADPELHGVRPLSLSLKAPSSSSSSSSSSVLSQTEETSPPSPPPRAVSKPKAPAFVGGENDFPPLGLALQRRSNKNVSKA
ncbi:unnamed protein product [Lactuca saligna]|uniref:Fe2OG dioxygenase domain-containing protein n=1 Tax=Lactuca saligna TaxID=75948 RepID=A0AA35Z7M9_LACSI|nr:unnamed protein product [Lactuca saligna]